MNKNEFIAKMQSPVREAHCKFQEKYLYYPSLWFALGCAAGVLAVKGYDRFREHQEEQLTQEIEQFYVDNPAKTDPAQ